jgi:hypothetical protein
MNELGASGHSLTGAAGDAMNMHDHDSINREVARH